MTDAADALYRLPLEDFTRERDALAKRLRAEKDRDGADAVKALRKPGTAAWIVNQLARSETACVEALLEAGESLRDAQADALSGSGSAGDLREAVAAERAAVDELLSLAAGLKPGGRAPSRAITDKVRALLHGAATDPALRELVRAGRVVSDEPGEAESVWGLGVAPEEEAAAKPARAKRKPAGEKRSAASGAAGAARAAGGRARGNRSTAGGKAATTKRTAADAKRAQAADAAGKRAAAREHAAAERARRLALREARAERTRLRKAAESAASACSRADDAVEQAREALADAMAAAGAAQSAFDAARAAAAEAEARVSELESA
jgi:hypothetical protein